MLFDVANVPALAASVKVLLSESYFSLIEPYYIDNKRHQMVVIQAVNNRLLTKRKDPARRPGLLIS